jgi:hypothetical protein
MVVVMVVIDVMMVMVVVMMVLHRRLGGHWRRSSGGGGCGFLRDSVSGEAERERRGRDKGLDHGRTFLWLGNPNGYQRTIESAA